MQDMELPVLVRTKSKGYTYNGNANEIDLEQPRLVRGKSKRDS